MFTFHMHFVCVVRSLHFRTFSASFLTTFLSHEIAVSFNRHVLFPLLWIMVSGLLLGMVLSVFSGWFCNVVSSPSWLVSANFGTCSYQCSLSNYTCISLHMLTCWTHTLSCLFYVLFFCQSWARWYYVVSSEDKLSHLVRFGISFSFIS
jgi:hypothetical protein